MVVILVVGRNGHRGHRRGCHEENPPCPSPCPIVPACPNCPNCTCPTPPGGILANCTNNTQCASGLICQSGECVCPQPAAPTITVTRPGGVLTWSWPAVVGAVSYNVFVDGPCYTTTLINSTATSGNSGGVVCAGTYTVSAQANTANCGSGPFSTQIVDTCSVDADCATTCNTTTGVCN